MIAVMYTKDKSYTILLHFVELGQSPNRPDLTNLLAALSTFIFKSFFIDFKLVFGYFVVAAKILI